jgi:hypothetical protein
MAASRYDFAIDQGSTFRLSLVYKDSNKQVINLTNWCARLIWKTNLNHTYIFLSTNNDDTQYKFDIDGPNGKIDLIIPAHVTNGYSFQFAKYDLELQSPDPIVAGTGEYTTRILFGDIKIIQRYTQSNLEMSC